MTLHDVVLEKIRAMGVPVSHRAPPLAALRAAGLELMTPCAGWLNGEPVTVLSTMDRTAQIEILDAYGISRSSVLATLISLPDAPQWRAVEPNADAARRRRAWQQRQELGAAVRFVQNDAEIV